MYIRGLPFAQQHGIALLFSDAPSHFQPSVSLHPVPAIAIVSVCSLIIIEIISKVFKLGKENNKKQEIIILPLSLRGLASLARHYQTAIHAACLKIALQLEQLFLSQPDVFL